MDRNAKIFVAGHTGLVGSAVMRALGRAGYKNLLSISRAALDLTDQSSVRHFFLDRRPEYVFHCAGKVGGIHANSTYPADFIRDNILMGANLIDASHRCGAKKILVLGSSCIYPRLARQPLTEDLIMTGALEPTNEPYAVAKLAGLSMARAYHLQYGMRAVLAIGANTYGLGDNFDLQNSHVIPALIHKFHLAKSERVPEVVMWGTGTPVREFIYVDDLADALIFLMNSYEECKPVNVGTGEEVTIGQLGTMVADVVGYHGRIAQDLTKPDGMPKKVLDSSRLFALGWKPRNTLRDGLATTYSWFKENVALALQ